MSFFISLTKKAATLAHRGRTLFAGSIVVACTLLSAQAAQADGYWQEVQARGALRCAAALAPPYVMKNIKTGEYGGAYLDLCKQFAKILDVKVEFVDTNWDNIVAGLQAGKWDLSPALNRTPTRALAINYSSIAGYDEMNFAYLADSAKTQNPTPDLNSFDNPDIRVGVMSGSAQDHKASERLTKAQIVRLPDAASLNLALLSGRIDVSAQDSTTNLLFETANPGKVKVLEANPPLMKQGISFGIQSTVAQRDIDVFNIFLEEKVSLGEVDKALKHYSEVYLKDATQ